MPSSPKNDHHERQPQTVSKEFDAHSPPEAGKLITKAALAKVALPWPDLILKSFFGGVFISMGGLFNLIVSGGATGLRESNPSLAILIGGFVFPIGFVFIIFTNCELATSNFFVLAFSTAQRKTSVLALLKNWVVSYIFNIAGCLFFAGFLTWWTDSLSTPAEKMFSVTSAEQRVAIPSYWSVNFLRGVGCNWLVGLAMFLAIQSKDGVSKIYSIWIPIWAFVGLGYQHSIANFFMVTIGMFYGTSFGVGAFIYKSVIPVTLGNIVGGAIFDGCAFWFLYGRDPSLAAQTGRHQNGKPNDEQFGAVSSDETSHTGRPGSSSAIRRSGNDASDRV